MQLFSTMLNVTSKLNADTFIGLVIDWNQSSRYEENIIPGITWNGERNIRFGDDRLWMAIEEYPKEDIIAVRYEKCDADGILWDTDYVLNLRERRLAIRLDRSYTEDALIFDPKFSTPFFIRLLINQGYVCDDGQLPVSVDPFEIDSNHLRLLADLINGEEKCQLPIVYVSKSYYDTDPVDTRRLSYRLKGAAHVLTQQSSRLTPELIELCDSDVDYYGAISIYYPNTAWEMKRYISRTERDEEDRLLEKVVRSVIQYNNTQMVSPIYTWQGVNNAILRDSLVVQRSQSSTAEEERRRALYELLELKSSLYQKKAEMKEAARAEADKVLEAFEEDMQRLQSKVEELTAANEKLTIENEGLRKKLTGVDAEPILYLGNEEEFFPGEIREILLKTLITALDNTVKESRRADVLEDIIDHNGPYQGIAEKRAEQLQKMLRGYKNVSGEMKRSLQEMGFVITDDGKHYKLTYYGDSRYWTALSKTPSDNRSGMNHAKNIIKHML